MTNRYRLSGTVDEAHLSSVIAAYSSAGLRLDFDPEITLSLLTKFNAVAPAKAEATPLPFQNPKPVKRAQKRMVKRNGGEWPAKGSIYDIVLEFLKDGPATPTGLRDVLKAKGKSPGSVNSALNRLAKNNKAQPTGSGTWAATDQGLTP